MQKHLVFGCFLVLSLITAKAQPSQSQAFLPKLMPQSPDVANLNRYGSIPVNLFTGVPDISIPLFEITVGELKVPITLSYHASGNKVTDNPSRVGLGWSVSAGGTISRKMMGKPDEQEGNYLSGITSRESGTINTDTYDGLNYLWNVSQGVADAEPDIFSYSIPGKSGKFVFNQRDNFKPIIMPYDPLVITRTHPTTATMLFKITDESGIQYSFDTYEWTANSSGASTQYAISSWPLTKMISANKKDTILFSYNDVSTQDAFFSDGLVVSDNIVTVSQGAYVVGLNPPYTDDPGTPFVSNSYISTTAKMLSEIIFKGGKVVFEEGAETRQDFNGSVLPKRLNRILVYSYDPLSSSYKLVRTVQFYQSYFINGTDVNTKRLKLDSITFKGADAVSVETYRFDYNNSVGLPRKDSRQKDYWGYFNSKANSSLIPRIQIPYVGVGGVTNIWVGSTLLNGRDPDPAYMQAWMLTRMTYPTGGYSDFEFETNKYADGANNHFFAGGLRIRKIQTYDGINASPIVKTYKYGQNESGVGRANYILNNYFFQTSQTNRYIIIAEGPLEIARKRTRSFLSSPTCDLEAYDGSSVSYPYVTEYNGTEVVNQGRTIFEFNDRPDVLNAVAEYGRPVATTYHFNRGQLISKTVQKISELGYTTVSKNTNQYEYFSEQFYPYLGFASKKQLTNDGPGGSNLQYGPLSATASVQNDNSSYLYSNYSIRTGDNRIKESTSIVYDDLDPNKFLTTTTKYFYDNFSHMQPTRVETTNSKGEVLLSTKKYSGDMTAVLPYSAMINNNILNRPIEDKLTNNAVVQTIQNTNFQDFGNNNYLPATIDLKVGTNPVETRAQFTKYSAAGNIQEMRLTNNTKSAYIWDYLETKPVAEAVNADESEIAYTSFESTGKGNWVFTGLPVSDATTISGSRVYNLANGTIAKSVSISPAKTYYVSYWTKNATAFTITGTQPGFPVSDQLINGWKYFIHKITGVSIITLSGTGLIDELRLFPAEARMATTVYEPLVGVVAQFDPNGRPAFYEYDPAGRVKLIRDKDRNIIKRFDYAYFGQNQGDALFPNQAVSGTFTRTNCTAGWVGATGVYTVPEGTYKSAVSVQDANSLAQQDVNQNGQTNINNGGAACMPSISKINNSSVSLTMTLTNTYSGAVTTLTIPVGATSTQIGAVPVGTYNISITQSGSTVVQVNFNAITQTGTSFSYTGVNLSGPVTVTVNPGPVSCSFAYTTGYVNMSNSFSSSNGVVTFYMTFYRTSAMTIGNTYFIGTVSLDCRPTATRTIDFSSSGRNWRITINTNGDVSWQLLNTSTSNVNANTVVSSNTQTYTK